MAITRNRHSEKLTASSRALVGIFVFLAAAFQTSKATTVQLVDFTGSANADFIIGVFPVTPSPEGLSVSTNQFGGAEVTTSLLTNPVLTTTDMIQVTARLDGGSVAPNFVIALRESSNEFFSYAFNTSDLTLGGFTTLQMPVTSFFFNGDIQNGVPDAAVVEVGYQSSFGTSDQLNITVSDVSLVSVPEPTSLGLLAIAGIFVLRRQRN